MNTPKRQNERGMALILCTLFTAATLVLLTTLSTRLVAQAKHVSVAEESVRVLAAAEDALAGAVAHLDKDGTASTGKSVVDGVEVTVHAEPLTIPIADDGGTGFVRVISSAKGKLVTRTVEELVRREGEDWVRVTWRELSG